MIGSLRERLFLLWPVRWTVAAVILARGVLRLALGRQYPGANDLCWVARVSEIGLLERLADRYLAPMIERMRKHQSNFLLEAYRSTKDSAACAARYSLAGPGQSDLFRDLIVLKAASKDEKGVILLKYARTFDAVAAMFDLPRLMERYIFVLEPCWAGLCDPSVLMYIAPGQPVFVLCFTEEDHRFISSIGAPLVPVRLGPADWTDSDRFTPVAVPEKTYDLVMVASWASGKRHAQLFRALSGIHDRNVRVLLIGFPWYGRTAEDVRREAKVLDGLPVTIDIVDSIPQAEIPAYLSRCKVFVFLSRKEGDNKSLVEAMFVNLPAIVYERTIGGAKSRINPQTGILSSDEELGDKIRFMLDHYQEFASREWALAHTGSANATRILDENIMRVTVGGGGKYTRHLVEKTNSPNLGYRNPADRERFRADYEYVRSCLRSHYGRTP